MSLFFLLLIVSASFVICTKNEAKEIYRPPVLQNTSHAALDTYVQQHDDVVKMLFKSDAHDNEMNGKIRQKRGGCCPMMNLPPASHPPSKTYVLEISAHPAPAPRPRPPPPPPPAEYVLVPVAVVHPVAPPARPHRPPRMQHRPMRHPPSTITITGTITKNEGGGCQMHPHC